MTNGEYTTWTQIHADLFGLQDERDAQLLILWAPILARFEFEELRAASLAVASSPDDQRRWRANHLSMLREAVLAGRADADARERERLDRQFATGSDCQTCHGTGLVRVPHPAFVVDFELEHPFYIGVACDCALGVARFNAINARLTETEAEHRVSGLLEYEALVPDWRRILADYKETQVREFDAEDLARKVDRVAPIDPAVIKRIADRGKP